jgi:hypothetical protein
MNAGGEGGVLLVGRDEVISDCRKDRDESGVFLTLCVSSAVSDDVAMGGPAKEIEMVARPGR